MYDGFIYETTCTANGMKYRGRHERSHSDSNDPDDSWYLGSPTNPQFWEDLEKYGRDAFTREIIQDGPFEDSEHISKVETIRLMEVDAANNPQYYNLSNWGGIRSQLGEQNHNYGRTWRQSEETCEKKSIALKGKPFTAEHCQHIKDTWDYSAHITPEGIRKSADARRGKKRPPMIYHVICIYCSKEFIGTGSRSRICHNCKLERSV